MNPEYKLSLDDLPQETCEVTFHKKKVVLKLWDTIELIDAFGKSGDKDVVAFVSKLLDVDRKDVTLAAAMGLLNFLTECASGNKIKKG